MARDRCRRNNENRTRITNKLRRDSRELPAKGVSSMLSWVTRTSGGGVSRSPHLCKHRPDLEVNSEELRDYFWTKISKYKVPKQFFLVDEVPRTPISKVNDPGLRDLALSLRMILGRRQAHPPKSPMSRFGGGETVALSVTPPSALVPVGG